MGTAEGICEALHVSAGLSILRHEKANGLLGSTEHSTTEPDRASLARSLHTVAACSVPARSRDAQTNVVGALAKARDMDWGYLLVKTMCGRALCCTIRAGNAAFAGSFASSGG